MQIGLMEEILKGKHQVRISVGTHVIYLKVDGLTKIVIQALI